MVAIGMETPENAAKTKAAASVSFSVLSDSDGTLVDHLGLRDAGGNGMDGSDVAQSASVFVSRSGEVRRILSADNYRVRPRVEVLLQTAQALKQKTQKVRSLEASGPQGETLWEEGSQAASP